ncbi:hypothetical protein Y032_0811g2468 [Ancylostoma ceylanicum]|uniref:Uncharacterized protein n=1 Tax=Ancylostoma ceylanicum TaxID=53326 RepID=A0A016WCA4_9BILA|nr:hypothetical protein Y032_0811g2468 [Ancylostoma ceylanicum]
MALSLFLSPKASIIGITKRMTAGTLIVVFFTFLAMLYCVAGYGIGDWIDMGLPPGIPPPTLPPPTTPPKNRRWG